MRRDVIEREVLILILMHDFGDGTAGQVTDFVASLQCFDAFTNLLSISKKAVVKAVSNSIDPFWPVGSN